MQWEFPSMLLELEAGMFVEEYPYIDVKIQMALMSQDSLVNAEFLVRLKRRDSCSLWYVGFKECWRGNLQSFSTERERGQLMIHRDKAEAPREI